LALEEEEEGTSYLADLNKVPDFIDEPPVEVGEVCNILLQSILSDTHACFIKDPGSARSHTDDSIIEL
jgi:hypothetical protein